MNFFFGAFEKSKNAFYKVPTRRNLLSETLGMTVKIRIEFSGTDIIIIIKKIINKKKHINVKPMYSSLRSESINKCFRGDRVLIDIDRPIC